MITTKDNNEQKSYCTDDASGSISSFKSKATALTGVSSSRSVSSQDSAMFFSDYKYSGYQYHDEYFESSALYCLGPIAFIDVEKGPPSSSSSSSNTDFILFGFDLSNQSPTIQFMTCACGSFFFTILYGYLQELIQIKIAGRQFALFLGSCQFAGYTFWSAVLSKLRTWRLKQRHEQNKNNNTPYSYQLLRGDTATDTDTDPFTGNLISQQPQQSYSNNNTSTSERVKTATAPILAIFIMAIIRAVDLGLTNMSMKYLNYPAKTLIKSSRVIFTMIMGIIIGRRKYSNVDYMMVLMLVCGLALFLHADMNSNAVFHPIGVGMLITSLALDATVGNWSELLMNHHNLGPDEFQMKLYFFSFILMSLAAHQTNELQHGIEFFFQTHGTMSEVQDPRMQYYSWSIQDKTCVLFLFCTLGIFGGSCACAITKKFGALAMSVTTTTRKAATIFLSLALFPNACTPEHIIGVLIFVMGLLMKGASKKS